MSKKTEPDPPQTMEDYLLAQLNENVLLKDGTTATGPDGKPLTKQQAIAMNIMNQAMKGDLKAAEFVMRIQAMNRTRKK